MLKKVISYSSGSITANLLSLAFGTYVQFYYIDTMKGSPLWIGLAATIQALYATLVYPFLGYLSDRVPFCWERRVAFIIYGAVPLGLTFILVWIPPFPSTKVVLFTAYFFITALLYDTFYNITMVNWSALFPELFHTSTARAYASAWKQMFGIIGLIAGLALPQMIASNIGWRPMAIIFGILSIATLFTTIPSFDLRHRREQALNQSEASDHTVTLSVRHALKYTLFNRSFLTFIGMRFFVQFAFTILTADLSYYTKYNLSLSGTQQSLLLLGTLVVALPLVYVWSAVIPRIGAFRSTIIAIILFGLALLPFLFVKSFITALLCGLAIGIGLSAILILTDVLISDVIDEDQLNTGERREGIFYGIHGLIVGFCTPAQAIVTTIVLTASGYKHSPHQSTLALLGFKLMITLIPILALIIGLIIFMFYPLKKEHVIQNQKKLYQPVS